MMASTEVLPWHQPIWERAQNSIRAGTLGHALLLAGPAGVGKRRFARSLAASLMCEARSLDGTACEHCRSCKQFAARSHPNLSWLSQEINEKTDREKRDISMEQLRAAMDRLALASHYGQARVVVIEPADALNISGVNAVLKTVEEPPAGCHVLLLSERWMALAPTLRSRCQRINFAVPAADMAVAWLKEQKPGADAEAALGASSGAPIAALEALESGAIDQRKAWRQGLAELAEHRLDPLTAASRIQKDEVADWIRTYLLELHQTLRALAGATDSEPRVVRLARVLGFSHVDALIVEAIESQLRLRGNANPQLLLESLMISWWHRAGHAHTRKTSSAA